MRMISVTADDLKQIDIAIRSFPGAWGCVGPDGVFRPGAADSSMLWIMIPSNAAEMDALWRRAGISTDESSSYGEMRSAQQHCITMQFFKMRKSLFSAVWIGHVSFDFDRGNLTAGCIAARMQVDMWRQLRAFIDGSGRLHSSAREAQAAI